MSQRDELAFQLSIYCVWMTTMKSLTFFFLAVLIGGTATADEPLAYHGRSGPGAGKRIVFLAGDNAYRSEETLPALARIMAKHHGFECIVLFSIDQETGEIVAGNSNSPGMEALRSADLAVVFLRFQNYPPEQMKHLDAYLEQGGPIVGMRTATHAFKMPASDRYAKYSFNSNAPNYELGFGHQVLGQTWVGHYGKNHSQSTRISIIPSEAMHPILRGVQDIWVQSGAYVGKPNDSEVLTMARALNGMSPDSPVDTTKDPQPSEWTRVYKSASGKEGRVFTTLYGAPEDLLNDGYRRMLVNGMFWAAGLEDAIDPNMAIDTVGPFKPNTFANGGHARGIKPSAYAGFQSPIPAHNNTKPVKVGPAKSNEAPNSQTEKATAGN